MKRHPALVSLSRDHYTVLYLSLRLRRATDDTSEEIARELLEQWSTEEAHLRREEEILLPACADHPQALGSDIAQVLHDHELIRQMAADISEHASPNAVRGLGIKLADHVRYEERIVFPHIETTLPDADLHELEVLLREDRDADRTRRPPPSPPQPSNESSYVMPGSVSDPKVPEYLDEAPDVTEP
jgi:iron-sulfur cluster repair protein YtfE (RIC family)